ncbi:helix-loop-helix DNA-binding domain-containing protein [Xylariomycetidae sp. FL0641]|nr:helix-loop-helix DNA-binding domain-containing protein [Xylariomycetidae sp. FL0641]
MTSAPEDDLSQFIDMGGMSDMNESGQFDFHAFMMQTSEHHEMMDTPMGNSTMPSMGSHTLGGLQSQVSPMTSAPSRTGSIPSSIMPSQHNPGDTITDIDAQIRYLQQQKIQEQQKQLAEQQRQLQEQQAALYAQQRSMVPPTPQSLEIQAANQFFANHERGQSSGMFDSYSHGRDQQQDMAFTPLVSPAVTPLDTQFSLDQPFAIPGAYFSPISSPALHAQADTTSMYDPRLSGQTNNSPVAIMDMELPSSSSKSAALSKDTNKNNAQKRKSRVRQSPITKPQRKKTSSTPTMNAQALQELAETTAERSGTSSQAKSASGASTEESSNASVSPEALNDMPPPPLPLPASARQSPRIQAQAKEKTSRPMPPPLQDGAPPATPASLFKISPGTKPMEASDQARNEPESMDSFELPAAMDFSSSDMSPLDTGISKDDTTPTVEKPQPAPFQPPPSPSIQKSARSSSIAPSPQIAPRPSSGSSKNTPVLGPKNSKKRPSVSSASPAILPRVSPNLKPLLPGSSGLPSEDTASQLLASKSNYQRILEGSTVPGVHYPSDLCTNLTSKRTSHKLAEQGRRNRINLALTELATLLPKSAIQQIEEGERNEKKDGKASSAPNSKASTVELAIDYIKKLQGELIEATQRADNAEKQLKEKTTES